MAVCQNICHQCNIGWGRQYCSKSTPTSTKITITVGPHGLFCMW